MPRAARVEAEEATHHVVARCGSRRRLFHDDADYSRYLGLLEEEVRRRSWRLLSFCLMPNHVHLLLRTPRRGLGAGIGRAHGAFARCLNTRHEMHGHVFGERFHNRLVVADRHVVACLRYIARNPVAAGLTATAAEWPWSAYRALAGLERPRYGLQVTDALEHLDAREPRRAYIALVERSDAEVLERLKAELAGDRWLVEAVDRHRLAPAEIARAAGMSRTALYRRLAAARVGGTEVPVP